MATRNDSWEPPRQKAYSRLDVLPFMDSERLRDLANQYDSLQHDSWALESFNNRLHRGFLKALLLELADRMEDGSVA